MKLIKELVKKLTTLEFIIVFKNKGGSLGVYMSDGKRDDELGWDEALGVVSAWIIEPKKIRYMKTKEAQEAWNKQFRRGKL